MARSHSDRAMVVWERMPERHALYESRLQFVQLRKRTRILRKMQARISGGKLWITQGAIGSSVGRAKVIDETTP